MGGISSHGTAVPSSRRPRWRRRLAAVVLGFVATYTLLSAAGSYIAVMGNHSAWGMAPQQIGASYTAVSFPSRVDHLDLRGWLFRSGSASGRSVILVHGWHGDREDVDFGPLAHRFLAQGYDVLMFDMRASGLSPGTTQTFASDEPRDLLGAYDFMLQRGYRPDRMTILGNSMGGATVIEAAPQLAHVAALITDSAFTSVTSAVEGGLTLYTGLPGPLVLPALEFSRLWGVDPSVSPISVVASLPHRAFLFIQATGDQLVDPHSAIELREASPDPASRLLLIPGHSHLDTFRRSPTVFMAAVDAFIDSQIRAAGG